MGTSLALTGAYVLAGELARHGDHLEGFAAYESLRRPYVKHAQQLPPGTPRVATPHTRPGIAVLNTAVRLGSTKVVSGLGSKLYTPPAEKIELPDYATS